MKVSEASVELINYYMACITGDTKHYRTIHNESGSFIVRSNQWNPCGNWAQGGPLSTTHRVSSVQKHDGWWVSCIYDINDDPRFLQVGKNRLETEIRTIVASRYDNLAPIHNLVKE